MNGLLDPQTATRFRELIEAAFSARQRIVDGEPVEAAAPWYVPFAKGEEKAAGFGSERFVRAVDVPSALFELAEAFERTGVRKAVADYFNERPAMIANKWVLRRSPSGVDTTGVPAAHASRIFNRVPEPLNSGTTATAAWANSAMASSTMPVQRTPRNPASIGRTACSFLPTSSHSASGRARRMSGQMSRANQRTACTLGWYSRLPLKATRGNRAT